MKDIPDLQTMEPEESENCRGSWLRIAHCGYHSRINIAGNS